MGAFSYLTISSPTQGLYKEKGSRFFSFAFPVEKDEQIKDHLLRLGKEYFDARHHCYAWVLGADKRLFRANDAGEPNHSAGDPILGQIRSRNLTNILVVVVRYFGGTKLGVGGLVSAYKLAASDALEKAVIIEKELTRNCTLSYDYASTPEVMKLIKDFELGVISQAYEDTCVFTIEVRLSTEESFRERLELLRALGHIHDYKIF